MLDSDFDKDLVQYLKLLEEIITLPKGDVSELLGESVLDDITLVASRVNKKISGKLISSEVLGRITHIKKLVEEEGEKSELWKKFSPIAIIYLIRAFAEFRYDKYRGSFWDIYDHGMMRHSISFLTTLWSCWIALNLQGGTHHVLGVNIGILPGGPTCSFWRASKA